MNFQKIPATEKKISGLTIFMKFTHHTISFSVSYLIANTQEKNILKIDSAQPTESGLWPKVSINLFDHF